MTSQISDLPFNPSKSEPSLTDLLNSFKRNLLQQFSCHHIGTIQSFNAENQTCVATVNYKKTAYQLNTTTGNYDAVLIDYPQAIDMPVICLGGGSASLTFPIAQGDECLILFNDRDMSNWFLGAPNGSTATARLHSFADGVVIVGLRSAANVLAAYDQTRAVLQNGSTMVGVGESLIKIANASYTLNGLLQNLLTQVENLVTATAAITVICAAPSDPSSIPVNAATITAIGTEISTIATEIGDLLE